MNEPRSHASSDAPAGVFDLRSSLRKLSGAIADASRGKAKARNRCRKEGQACGGRTPCCNAFVCSEKRCVKLVGDNGCPPGLTMCNGQCRDLMTDCDNCGECRTSPSWPDHCRAQEVCQNGRICVPDNTPLIGYSVAKCCSGCGKPMWFFVGYCAPCRPS